MNVCNDPWGVVSSGDLQSEFVNALHKQCRTKKVPWKSWDSYQPCIKDWAARPLYAKSLGVHHAQNGYGRWSKLL